MSACRSCVVWLLVSGWLAGNAFAEEVRPEGFISDGSAKLAFRYRFEGVDQAGFSEDAKASTLRSRLTLESGKVMQWQAFAEVDDIRELFWDDFNAGGGNTPSRVAYPTVADPQGTEINQVYINYQGFEHWHVSIGRQRINFDNQRFVGGVGWRQNEQTYDALRLTYEQNGWTANYAYVDNVNRIFGEDVDAGDHRQDGTHLVNAATTVAGLGTVSAYFYQIDNDDAALFSTRTIGARLQGRRAYEDLAATYALEYASQSDHGDNPTRYDAHYVRADVGVVVGKVDASVGVERLGAKSGGRFVTPLATLHAFNGWADQFLAGGSGNPPNGLEDRFAILKASLPGGVFAQLRWHDFESDRGGQDLGSELNFSATKSFSDNVTGAIFYADFEGDGGFRDSRKFWLMITVTLG